MNRLRIAVPTGDAAGIGPEVVIKALLHGFGPRIVPIAVGDARLLQRTLEDVGLPGHLRILTDPAAATGGPGTVDVLDVPVTGLPGVIPGKVQAVAGQGAYLFIQRAVQCALAGTVDALRPGYTFDVSCQGTVPAALIAFLDAESYEQTVRNAVSLGGDSDTLACIAGGIAEAFYGGVPDAIRVEVRARLTPDLWRVVEGFERRYGLAKKKP